MTISEEDGTSPRRLISKRQMLEMVPLSYPTIWDRMRRGEFPLSVKLDDAGNRVFWFADEIQTWINDRPRSELKPAAGRA